MLLLLEKWKKWQTKGASKREGGRESFRASRYSNIWYLYIVYQPFYVFPFRLDATLCYNHLPRFFSSLMSYFLSDQRVLSKAAQDTMSVSTSTYIGSFLSLFFRVILEKLFSSQTVYAPWVLEVLQMGYQNLENTGTCNCSSERMYMIVQLCVLKISRKWNFYYWRNECLEIQYSSEIECIIQCSQLAFFCTVSEFPVSKCRRQTSNQQL